MQRWQYPIAIPLKAVPDSYQVWIGYQCCFFELFIFVCSFSESDSSAFLAYKKEQIIKINHFSRYLEHFIRKWFKGAIVNRAFPSLQGGFFAITLTWPFGLSIKIQLTNHPMASLQAIQWPLTKLSNGLFTNYPMASFQSTVNISLNLCIPSWIFLNISSYFPGHKII